MPSKSLRWTNEGIFVLELIDHNIHYIKIPSNIIQPNNDAIQNINSSFKD